VTAQRELDVLSARLDLRASPVRAADTEHSARAEHPSQLAERRGRTREVLEHRMREDAIEAPVGEGQVVDRRDLERDTGQPRARRRRACEHDLRRLAIDSDAAASR